MNKRKVILGCILAAAAVVYFMVLWSAHASIWHAPGNASVYGGNDGNCGSMTASGERFDCRALTAAHKTIRLGSLVSVCRRELCVVVRINDRGPYIAGREIDLSPTAARAIACDGMCDVSLHLVSEPVHDIKVASNTHPQRGVRHVKRRHHYRQRRPIVIAGEVSHSNTGRRVLSRSHKAVRRTARRAHERHAKGARRRVHVSAYYGNIRYMQKRLYVGERLVVSS